MLRKIRISLAVVFFVGITLLFLDFTGTLHAWLGWMAKVQFLPALLSLNVALMAALVLLTLIFGRIYCSVICPLGVMQDVIAWFGKQKRKRPYNFSPALNWLRYTMLVVFLGALVVGLGSVVALLAPYSSYGRIAANLLQPVYIFANNGLALIAERVDSYAFYSADVWLRSLPTFLIAVVTFVLIFILAWKNGRTYCNTVCPVGTILSFLARFSWLKIYFDGENCRSCSKCTHHCKAACIDYKTLTVDYSRCVTCGDCLEQCAFSALTYGHPSRTLLQANREKIAAKANRADATKHDAAAEVPQETVAEASDSSRRTFLLTTALAVTTAVKAQKNKKVDGGLAVIEDKVAPVRATPITPPGSFSAENMAKHCTGCQLCVAECPNGVLRPSTDPMKLMQPTMSYERGYCRPECTRCSEVCPTGAIHLIDKATKSSTQLGHAVWIKKNCVVITDGVECGNCARHCPSGAIDMVDLELDDRIASVPSVNASRCIGCGACENLCPARPFAAIYVEGHEVHKTN
jgi:formate hydrogenlyase subunit 6/NADH:ubiquinone oxidoreductase subunit I/uncharacterized membrane protein YedE/YeeE